MPKQQPDDVPDEQRYPRIAEAVQQRERSDNATMWDLVDALHAEAQVDTAHPQGTLREMERIAAFIDRIGWGSGSYSPRYLATLHRTGRWADGHPEVRNYPVAWASACQQRSVPVLDAVPLMAQARKEPPPEGTRDRAARLRDLITRWKTPSLDARRDGDDPVPPQVAQYRKLKAAERAATNLGQLVRWAERADPDELVVFAEDARALYDRLGACLSTLDQPAKPKRRRKATTA